MTRTRKLALLTIALLLALTACGGSDEGGSESSDGTETEKTGGGTTGERIDIGGDEALMWGEGGDYGVVLAHGAAFDAASWEDQATAIADQGATVVAVENIDPSAIEAAADYLRDEGLDDVALIGGSAGADGILQLLSEKPDTADLLITLAVNTEVEGIGEAPKLFIVSEGDPVAGTSMALAENAEGDDNELEVLPGSAHAQNIFDTDQGEAALDLILERLAA